MIMVEYLLNHGANMYHLLRDEGNIPFKYEYYSIFYYLYCNTQYNIIKLFLKYKFNIIHNFLKYESINNRMNINILLFLLENGLDTSEQNQCGDTLLHHYVYEEKTNYIALIIEYM